MIECIQFRMLPIPKWLPEVRPRAYWAAADSSHLENVCDDETNIVAMEANFAGQQWHFPLAAHHFLYTDSIMLIADAVVSSTLNFSD